MTSLAQQRCSWCGEPDQAAYHGCGRPASERRRAGWPAEPRGRQAGGRSRGYCLTPRGWAQARYRLVGGQWVREARP